MSCPDGPGRAHFQAGSTSGAASWMECWSGGCFAEGARRAGQYAGPTSAAQAGFYGDAHSEYPRGVTIHGPTV